MKLQRQKSNQQLKSLQTFKRYMNTDFIEKCKQEYGILTFNSFIKPYLEDMLENFECEVEQVAEQALLEDELSYDEHYQGE